MIGYEVQSLVTSGDVQAEVLLFRGQGAVIDRVEGRTDLARGAVKTGKLVVARLLPAASFFSREDRDHKYTAPHETLIMLSLEHSEMSRNKQMTQLNSLK